MSKHKPPRPPVTPSASAVTANSSAAAILAEKVKLRLELIQRLQYQELVSLRARVAGLPPVPSPHDEPDNDV